MSTTTVDHESHDDHAGHGHDGHEHDGHEHDGHDHDGHEHDGNVHKSMGFWISVALVLAAMTGLETLTYFVDFGNVATPLLLILMTIKFVTVVSLFMHLRFDNKLFSWLFYAGLLLAVFVYVAALLTFRFFGST